MLYVFNFNNIVRKPEEFNLVVESKEFCENTLFGLVVDFPASYGRILTNKKIQVTDDSVILNANFSVGNSMAYFTASFLPNGKLNDITVKNLAGNKPTSFSLLDLKLSGLSCTCVNKAYFNKLQTMFGDMVTKDPFGG